jgi:hypothetical protein
MPGGGSGCGELVENTAPRGWRKSQAADEFTQHLRGAIVAALHESMATKPVAAEGMRDIVVFHSMTASARPCVAEGRDAIMVQKVCACDVSNFWPLPEAKH